MSRKVNTSAIVLFFISILYTCSMNMLNIHAIKKANPTNAELNARSLVYNATIYSIDNYWYLNHVKNYLATGKFTVDTTKYRYEVRRTPVYPLFYGAHYLMFGEKGSYISIRYTQTFLLALAVALLFLAVYNFTGNKTIGLFAALLYGLQPCVALSAFYTNTESLSSELVCYFLYGLSLCKINPSKNNWLITGILFALGVLCRPPIIFLAISCLFAIFYFNKWNFKNSIVSGIFFTFGAAILLLPWTIRNYIVTNGEIIVMEKYYGDPMDYGMPNVYLRSWISCWMNPADYSSEKVSNLMLTNLSYKEPISKKNIIDSIVDNLPSRALIGNNKTAISSTLSDLYEYYRFKNLPGFKNQFDSTDKVVTEKMHLLKSNFIKKSAIDYYVITPLLFAKSVIFQSNSTSLTFLDNYHGNYLKIAVKALLYLINVLSFLSILFLLFYIRKYVDVYLISTLGIACTFFVIIYILQYFENRYNFPVYPFMYTLLAISLYEIFSTLKDRFRKN